MNIPVEVINGKICQIRGQNVILDSDLAQMYDVETKVLNQAVKRNRERFPEDFMFQVTEEEIGSLRSQSVTLKPGRGQHRKYLPYVFTEQGVAMLSSILKRERAVQVNIAIMRTFVQMRQLAASSVELTRRIDELEGKYDSQFRVVFDAIRQMMTPMPGDRKPIGFRVEDGSS